MTLRLTEEQDAALTALAARHGISKNEAVVRAILAQANSETRRDQIEELTDHAIKRYAPLLDRLGQ